MQINPGDGHMPDNLSHATLTIERQNPDTKSKEIKKYVWHTKGNLCL